MPGVGLQAATSDNTRAVIVPIYNAAQGITSELQSLWADKTPTKAHELLSKPDVTVTNQSDKEAQLPKILKMNDEVKGVMEGAPADAVHITVQDV